MGIFRFIADAKERAERCKKEAERKLLEEPHTARAVVVDIWIHCTHEMRIDPCNPCKAPELVDDYWTKPVVKYTVDNVPIRIAVGKPNEWTDHGKKSIYKVGSEVIVRYQPDDHSRCEILHVCNT